MGIKLAKAKKRKKAKKGKKPRKTKKSKKKKKVLKKPTAISKESKIPYETIDDLLLSDYVTKDKLFRLVDLSNLSYTVDESKENLVRKLLYESTMGLDEMANMLWDAEELKEICQLLNLSVKHKQKNNLIGVLISFLQCKKKRKIETIIEEAVEDDLERLRIFNIFVIYPDGRSLFSYNLEAIPIGEASMITSALSAISHLLKEITKSEKRLDSVDVTDKHLLFEYGNENLAPGDSKKKNWNLVGVLMVNNETKEAHQLLEDFLLYFENKYMEYLKPRFDGCIDYFTDADLIIKEVFQEYLDL